MGINPRPRSIGDEERGQQRLDGGDGLDQVQGVGTDGGAGHEIAAAPAQGVEGGENGVGKRTA